LDLKQQSQTLAPFPNKVAKITIAIDGYSSCGKSTLAKTLAHSLGYQYIDTGAMYRCVTLYVIDNKMIYHGELDVKALVNHLDDIDISFRKPEGAIDADAFLNGVNVEEKIRGMNISNHVSLVSAVKEVRLRMVALQQKMGHACGVIMEGRDIGTVVLPNAELKIFMTASLEVRVRRRFNEIKSKGQEVSLEEVKENVLSRDYKDTHREESPLLQANDAVVLDNSNLSHQEQLDFALKLVEEHS